MYVKRGDTAGTMYASHFDWLLRTFWWALLWLAISAIATLDFHRLDRRGGNGGMGAVSPDQGLAGLARRQCTVELHLTRVQAAVPLATAGFVPAVFVAGGWCVQCAAEAGCGRVRQGPSGGAADVRVGEEEQLRGGADRMWASACGDCLKRIVPTECPLLRQARH